MDTQTFIDKVASGDAAQAKDILNDLLANRAFEALDAKKTEFARTIFNGKEDESIESEVEIQDTEETAAEE